MKEFLILRHGEPFLFGLELTGPTWVNPLLFERPIEKIGGGLELFWDGNILDSEKVNVTRILAHWKKQLTRRAKKLALPLDSIVELGPLTKEEREEFLFSVNRGDKHSETTLLRLEHGFKMNFRLSIFGKIKRVDSAEFSERAQAVQWNLKRLEAEGIDPKKVGIYEYLSPLAFELHGRTDEKAIALLRQAHLNFIVSSSREG